VKPLRRKVHVNEGDYRKTMGKRSEKKMPTGKILGFRKFDIVRYLGKIYSIKGRMSSGYANLMDKGGKDLKLRPLPKFDKLIRLQGRSSCITFQS